LTATLSLTVRPARPEDGGAVAEIYNQGIEERQATFETRLRTPADCEGQIAAGEVLVAEVGGRVVGWAGIAPYSSRSAYRGVGECSLYVERDARREGVGRRLLEELCSLAEQNSYHKLLGKLFPDNGASMALVHACGFRDVGLHLRHGRLDGEWRDVLVVERLLGEASE
jgi:L-amino acid N-acyltransferase YncA